MDSTWTLPQTVLTELRNNARAVVPAIADTLARTVMTQLPDQVFTLLSSYLARDVQNKLVGHLFSAAYQDPGPPVLNEAVVTLWASEVAAYLDRDTYHSRLQMLGRVWRRANDACVEEVRRQWLARGRRPRVTAPDEITPVIHQHDPFPDIRTAAEAQAFCAHSSAGQRAKLYMAKGTLLEEDTSNLLAQQLAQPVVLRNSSSVWSAATGAVRPAAARTVRGLGPINEPGQYVIHGEVDGWLLDPPYANVIVEYKLRMRGVKQAVPERDVLQIQTYLAMHGADKALHVQRTFGTDELKITTILRDTVTWDAVIRPGLDAFVCDIRRLLRGALEDEPLRHAVLSACERSPAMPAVAVAHVPVNIAAPVALFNPAEDSPTKDLDWVEPSIPPPPVPEKPAAIRKGVKRCRAAVPIAVPIAAAAAPPRGTRAAALRALAKMTAVIAEGHFATRGHHHSHKP